MGWNNVPVGSKASQILQITQAIYSHRNLPVPAQLDHWWHSPQVKYLVEDPNALKPKICIINLGEGEPDQPSMSAHFMVNLDMMRVTDKWTNEKFVAPQEIRDLLKEVRAYVVGRYRHEKEQEERYARKQMEIKEAAKRKEREDIQKFHDKLIQNNVMTPDEIAAVPVESKSCPACSVHSQVLAECAGCKSFVCLTKDCLAFELDEPKQCFQHSNEIYCKACLCGAVEGNSTGSPDPFLRKCPSDGCDRWMCKSNWKWCLGEPIDAVKVITTDDANSSDKEEFNDERPEQPRTKKQKLGQQPRHDRRLALCSICLEDLPPDQSWQSCDSFQGCWSNPTGSGCICPECLTEGGIECVGGHYWICYSCSEKSFPRVWPCPSCENSFCRQCKVVDRCQGCGLSQMCKDCKLENSNAEPGGADTDVELVSECTDCSDYLLCQTCSNRLTNYCGACGDRVCEECAADTCIECEKSICQRCAKGFPECSCGGAWREIRPKEG